MLIRVFSEAILLNIMANQFFCVMCEKGNAVSFTSHMMNKNAGKALPHLVIIQNADQRARLSNMTSKRAMPLLSTTDNLGAIALTIFFTVGIGAVGFV